MDECRYGHMLQEYFVAGMRACAAARAEARREVRTREGCPCLAGACAPETPRLFRSAAGAQPAESAGQRRRGPDGVPD